MANNKIDITIAAKDDASKALKQVKGEVDDLGKTSSANSGNTDKFGLSLGKVGLVAAGVIAGGALIAIVDQVKNLGNELVDYVKKSSQAAQDFEKSMISLEIIAPRFKVPADAAKKAANELAKELRIGVGSSAEALQNLLKSGLNLEQATLLIRRFTNEALTGKSANIGLSEAVQNLSYAYATANSALGNMSGISENFSNIIESGKKTISDYLAGGSRKLKLDKDLQAQIKAYSAELKKNGKALSATNDDQGKYVGMVQLTNLTLGSSAKFVGTYTDKLIQLQQRQEMMSISLGEKVNPILAQFLDTIDQTGVLDSFGKLLESVVIPPLNFLSEIFKIVVEESKKFGPEFENLKQVLVDQGFVQGIRDIGNEFKESFKADIRSSITETFERLKQFIEWLKTEEGKKFLMDLKNTVQDVGMAFRVTFIAISEIISLIPKAITEFTRLKNTMDSINGAIASVPGTIPWAVKGVSNLITGKKASGGRIYEEGLYQVNERGKEYINLPRGTQVTPAEQVNNTSNSNKNVTINNYISGGNLDPRILAANIAFRLA